jgi:penicillin amidase
VNLNRFLKYINIIVAVFVAAVTGPFGTRLSSPPQTSGEIPAPFLRASRSFDSQVCRTSAAALVIFVRPGYCAAQTGVSARVHEASGTGTLAEIFGRVAVPSDIDSRRMRLRRLAEQHVKRLPENDRKVLAAYARGINHFLETHVGSYPIEFTLLGFDPAPWSLSDSVLVALTLYRTLTDSWRDELVKKAMLETGEKDKVNALFRFAQV